MDIRDEILARMYVMLTVLCLVPLAVGVQVVRVGLIDAERLEDVGEGQTNSVIQIPAMRGSIVDRKGRTLVVNTARFDVAVDPSIRGYTAAASELYTNLASLTGRRASVYRNRVRARASSRYAMLERGLTPTQLSGLDRSVPGLIVEDRHRRTYNHGSLGAHVLGHVGSDLRGLAGLELVLDERLTGVEGERQAHRDRIGNIRPAAAGAVTEPRHGSTVVLTIDLVRQTILEEELAKGVLAAGARWGTAVAVNPKTGAILAMANYPTYDPNRPGAAADFNRRNHAVVDRVEPGSTFKLVTAAAAIQSGTISMSDTVDTGPGWIVLHGRTLSDTRAYGRIPFREVISVSSNIGAAKVAERTNPEDFYRMARSLGFGMAAGIDLPGEIGGRLRRVNKWSRSTLSAMSRGYEVTATPLQILSAYSALANGGVLLRPYVVDEIRDVTGDQRWKARTDSVRRVFSKTVARTLLPAFELVVTEGTAKEAAIPGVRVAGKTGTAWKVINGAYSRRHSTASFVGFFPADDPVVAMIVLMDEPSLSIYGGVVAAPVFSEIGRRWLPTLESLNVVPDSVQTDSLRAPNLEGFPETLANSRILSSGLRAPEVIERQTIVSSQVPAPGQSTFIGARVRVDATTPDQGFMPDLTGWTVREATYWLSVKGVGIRVQGSGSIRSQTPAPGASLPKTATITAGD